MVGGKEVIFETTRQGFDIGAILDAVLELWPDAIFQDAEGEEVRPLAAVLAEQAAGASREFFVYKDRASADSWESAGWTPEHGNDMAQFLVVGNAAHPEAFQLTLVIGSDTAESVPLVHAVSEALVRMQSRRGSEGGPGHDAGPF